jgi:hypothetical protein
MTETQIDSLYGELCLTLTKVGEAGASLFLARFALLAIGAIDDAERVRELLAQSHLNEAHWNEARTSTPTVRG